MRALPGMGTAMFDGINGNQPMLVQGVVLVVALAFIIINIIVDLLYVLINPRLLVKAVVFFYLDFDEKGEADRGWNLPLRNLADRYVTSAFTQPSVATSAME